MQFSDCILKNMKVKVKATGQFGRSLHTFVGISLPLKYVQNIFVLFCFLAVVVWLKLTESCAFYFIIWSAKVFRTFIS